jgi:multiple sugar transport system substrate-binding protein
MRTRRDFLKTALGTSAALLAAACAPPSQPAATSPPAGQPTAAPKAPAEIRGTEVTLLQWNHFIPTADPFFRKQAEEFSSQSGVTVNVEPINANDLLPRFTAAIQAQSGPTIFQLQHLQAHTLAQGLHDVTDLAREIEPKFGKYYPQADASCLVGDKYRAIPWNILGNAFVYRKSWFEQAGAKVPDTWDELRESARKLKATGKPFGQAFGQSFGDPPSFCYPVMWSFGGKELEADGKTVAINSTETIESVKYTIALWKDGLDERGLSWDDNNNNAAFLAEEISATLNGASIYFVGAGLRNPADRKPWADDMDHFINPKGPAGQFQWGVVFGHAIPSYVNGKQLDAAREYLRYIYEPKQFDAWFDENKGYSVGPGERLESHKMWDDLPKPLAPYKTAGRYTRALGYAGQPSDKVGEVQARYIVVNMFARAIQGQTAEDTVRQAETEMKQIFR